MNFFLISTIEQGFIFGLVALGVFITYRILDFPDLSVDGTFPLGAAVSALCLSSGMNPFLSLIFAIIAGFIAGGITGILHVKLKITNLLSGILVMIALYSINLRIMGKPNVQLFSLKKVFDYEFFKVEGLSSFFIIVLCIILFKVLLDLFLKTKLGFLLRAVGDNESLVTSLGVDKDIIKVFGLMLSNGIVAFAGGLMAQYQGFADVTMGTGTVVTGLASVIIGSTFLKNIGGMKGTTIAIVGAMLYKIIISLALSVKWLQPSDLKLITAVIVVMILSLNNTNFKLFNRKEKNVLKNRNSDGGDLVA